MSPATLRVFPAQTETEQIFIRLDGRGNRLYYPGETLAGSYYLSQITRSTIETAEISILWRTEGKGNEDVGVHAFWRLSSQDGDWIGLLQPGRFSSVLPKSPLSYEGALIKIRWCVRARVFLANGEQLVDETYFRLGNLPDMRILNLTAPNPADKDREPRLEPQSLR
ncbi:MAG: hypothetical protein Q4G03_00270 [Planctomycetia bacterium]|nr:hypothetical protein [Planctomycetia bacterium]